MGYKLIGDNNILDPIQTVLKNRKIEDVEKFLKPNINNTHHYSLLDNMDKAVELFMKTVENDGKILVLVDADADGYTSGAPIIDYTRRFFPDADISYMLHEQKEHGLSEKIMNRLYEKLRNEKEIFDLLIIPDSGSGNDAEIKELNKLGIEVLILDHHETDHIPETAVFVNNQYSPNYPNKNLSGAGIAYKFLQALDDEIGQKGADKYLDHVAIGNIGDVMNLAEPETRYYVFQGLKNIKCDFWKEAIARFAKDYALNPRTVSYKILPSFNAMIRIGSMEDKELVFRSMLGEEESFFNTRRKKEETLAFRSNRLCFNIKNKQDKMNRETSERIKEEIDFKGLNNHHIITVIEQDMPRSLTGLVASRLVSTYRKPVMVIYWSERNQMYQGSMRGYDKFTTDTKKLLNSTNLFEMVSGHPQAAGVKIKKENLEKLNDVMDKLVENFQEQSSSDIEVDFVLNQSMLTKQLIEEFVRYEQLWGQGVSEPVFAIKGIEIISDKIQVKNLMGKFFLGTVEYIQFQLDDEIRNIVDSKDVLVLDAVGTVSINRFNGDVTPQLVVDKLILRDRQKQKKIFNLFS